MSILSQLQQRAEQFFYQSNKIAGVEYLQTGDRSLLHVVVMERKNKKAEFTNTYTALDSWEALKKVLDKDCPIFLSINTRSVIHRKIQGSSGSESNALQQVFPNAAIADFYVQRYAALDGEIISIARRDAIDRLLAEAMEAGLPILHSSLGPFAVVQALPLLPATTQTLLLSSHILQIQQGQIVDFQINAGEVAGSLSIEGAAQSINNELWVAMSLALWGLSDLKAAGLAVSTLAPQQSEFLYKKIFQATGLGLLGFFFVALLINYLLFSSYQESNQTLETSLQHKEFLIKQRDTLRSQYQSKSAFLGETAVGKASKASFYADQLAASLPSSIRLTDMSIYPLIVEKNTSTAPQLPRYETTLIRIKGQCTGSVFYNNWKKAVQELYWVAEIHNLLYRDLDDDTGQFELEIRIK